MSGKQRMQLVVTEARESRKLLKDRFRELEKAAKGLLKDLKKTTDKTLRDAHRVTFESVKDTLAAWADADENLAAFLRFHKEAEKEEAKLTRHHGRLLQLKARVAKVMAEQDRRKAAATVKGKGGTKAKKPATKARKALPAARSKPVMGLGDLMGSAIREEAAKYAESREDGEEAPPYADPGLSLDGAAGQGTVEREEEEDSDFRYEDR